MVQSLDDARRRNQAVLRVPPHNLQAEQSLLGAMLLSRDAIAAAVETCGAEDFYKPAHGHVFEAITTLYSQGEPVDPLTVGDVLARAGLLEAVGGLPSLTALQADTPATANAGRYARIVEEHALLRKLIGVAGEIADLGYSIPDDVAAAVDRAESLVFNIAERRVTDSLKPLKVLLEESLDRLSALFSRQETITGVPTGYRDLDEHLSGLQPSALTIVGARPAMGKALALDTPIPTPTGWTTMGDLAVDDEVLDRTGRPCRVTYLSPIRSDRSCYRVELDDGSCVVADADHQWLVWALTGQDTFRGADGAAGLSGSAGRSTRAGCAGSTQCATLADGSGSGPTPRVVTTAEMLAAGLHAAGDRPRWAVPLAAPLDLPELELPLDPYLLGRRLGEPTDRAGQPAVAGTHGDLDGKVLPRIPPPYLRSSTAQRRELLQGIVETAGAMGDRGEVEVCVDDEILARQVRELVCSLGHGPGALHRPSATACGGRRNQAWALSWPVAVQPVAGTVARPLGEMSVAPGGDVVQRPSPTRSPPGSRAIRAITPVPSVPVRCITVDSPSHLYLAGESMIPTHNTAFALGIAAHASMLARVPTLVFSLEMSHAELTQRLLVSEARVHGNRIRNGQLHESDWPKISNAIGRLGEAPLFIDDNPNVTVMEVRAKARRMKAKEGLGLIVVDYLQLMTGRSSAENRQVEVSEISRGLKILARELEVPVVALSQLSRTLESRADKRPILADLRESGSLEQDADVVVFLYRDEMYNSDSPDRGTAEVIIAKHRNGPTGRLSLAFLDHYTRFADMARV